MPTLKTSKQQLRKYLNKELSDEELKETITMLGTDIEAFSDEEVKIEVFPDRPDMLSAPGIIRAVNNFIKKPSKKAYQAKKGKAVVEVDKSVENVRAHTRCLIARNITIGEEELEELIELQEKLHVTYGRNRKKVAIGMYPLEHIKLPITYQAKKPEDIQFIPLESNKQMNAKQLLNEHPTGKKYAHLLKEHKKYPVFTDANNTVLSVPPIINSKQAGAISTSTTELFVEVSGHLPRALQGALNMIACALIDMGASIETVDVIYADNTVTSPQLQATTKEIDLKYVLERSKIPEKSLQESLEKMGLKLEKNTVHIPAYRMDFMHDVDVIEDALIGYGYNNLPSTIPTAYTTGGYTQKTQDHDLIRSILCGLGLQEVMTYTLAATGVSLANPLTQEYSHLREEILNNLLGVLENNLSRSYPQNIYEIGPVFATNSRTETGLKETDHIAILLCSEQANYTRIRQVLEALTNTLDVNIEFSEHEDKRFISGRCAQVSGDIHGIIGEIHPQELSSRGIMQPASACEFYIK